MLTLPILFQDHMVLQRNKPIRIQGTAAPGALVEAVLSKGSAETTFVLSEGSAKADQGGGFVLLLPAASAACGCTLCVTSEKEKLVFEDVAVGDVWMAMGQSNMEYFLRYDANWQETRRRVRSEGPDPFLRMFNCPQIAYEGFPYLSPESGVWFCEGEAPWRSFSAPGYYFARTLRDQGIDVPLAVIGCNWGGTPAQAWMSEAALEKAPLDRLVKAYRESFAGRDLDELEKESRNAWASECSYDHGVLWRAMMQGMDWDEQEEWMVQHESDPAIPMGPWHHYRPSGLYHTMVEKLAPFSISGFLWYQGESNCGADADLYEQTMEELVRCLRKTWQDEDTPFYFVQLAPFSRWLACRADGYAIVRAQQEAAAQSIPLSAVTNVMDLGEHDDIHPKHKKEVGRRLAALALHYTYDRQEACGIAPRLKEARITSDTAPLSPSDPFSKEDCRVPSGCVSSGDNLVQITLRFENCGSGLTAEQSFQDAVCLYTKAPGAQTKAWPEDVCTACTIDYFTQQTGFDYRHPIPVSDAEAHGEIVSLTARVDSPDTPLLLSFAETDWCQVPVHSSHGIPIAPFHVILRT